MRTMRAAILSMSPAAVRWITLAVRLIVAAVFIFSGFVKAVDPWGTLYKTDDYLEAMHLHVWPNLELVGVFFLCMLEFCMGVMLALGCFRRSVAWIFAAVMAFMLPLSLWIAITDPVADCGCFGDAYVISNWATFWKNVALCIGVGWLLGRNRLCRWTVTPALQWIALLATVAYIGLVAIIGYTYQPLVDFRPYKAGTDIIDFSGAGDEGPRMVFVYEKDGVTREFSEDDTLPDEADGWRFVDRRELPASSPAPEAMAEAKDFRIWDGDEDVTEDVISRGGGEILLMMPRLSDVSIATSWKINSLYTWARRNGMDMMAVVAGSKADIDNWVDLSMASYPIYTADDTAIKEVVRGNPSVVYLHDGKIGWKSTLAAMDVDDFMAPGTSDDPMSFQTDNARMLFNFSMVYAAVIALLIVLSFSPLLKDLVWGRRGERQPEEIAPSTRDDKAPRAE